MTTEDDRKGHLLGALTAGREALLWKLDGLSERDVRWPVVPTGTNLLGLVKHLASVEAWYLGDVFGRPSPERLPWLDDDAEPNADMWATAQETRASVLALWERVRAHSEATVAALPLDAPGVVPWWPPERNAVTLHQVLVHLVAETHRHAGHADLVRELLDGAAGVRPGNATCPSRTTPGGATTAAGCSRSPRPPRSERSGQGRGGSASGGATAEQAAAEEGALQGVVAVDAAAAEAGDLAGGVQARRPAARRGRGRATAGRSGCRRASCASARAASPR